MHIINIEFWELVCLICQQCYLNIALTVVFVITVIVDKLSLLLAEKLDGDWY